MSEEINEENILTKTFTKEDLVKLSGLYCVDLDKPKYATSLKIVKFNNEYGVREDKKESGRFRLEFKRKLISV